MPLKYCSRRGGLWTQIPITYRCNLARRVGFGTAGEPWYINICLLMMPAVNQSYKHLWPNLTQRGSVYILYIHISLVSVLLTIKVLSNGWRYQPTPHAIFLLDIRGCETLFIRFRDQCLGLAKESLPEF